MCDFDCTENSTEIKLVNRIKNVEPRFVRIWPSNPRDCGALRVEFLWKTDGGYHEDAGVKKMKLANLRNSLPKKIQKVRGRETCAGEVKGQSLSVANNLT